MRFSYRMVPEVYQVFWAGMAGGEFINDAAITAGSYRKQGNRQNPPVALRDDTSYRKSALDSA